MSAEYNIILEKCRRGELEIKADSREVKPGDIYVAIPGEKDDGARYIADALRAGASYVVCEATPKSGFGNSTVIIRDNARKALSELASARYGTGEAKAKIIGVTGTNGKTTSAYLLEHLFSSLGYKTGVLGTVSYRWGETVIPAPLTTPDPLTLHKIIAEMNADGVQYIIMEVSSHALAQFRADGLPFAAALFTNLTQDHLDYHPDMESYFRAKARLFFDLPDNDKKMVINGDDPYGRRLLELFPDALSFGLHCSLSPNKSLKGKILRSGRDGHKLEMSADNTKWTFDTPLVGEFNIYNLLGAQGVALSLGIEPERLTALGDFAGVRGRLERVPNAKGLNIFVDYAHTPDALIKAIQALRESGFRKIIALFGCGGDRDKSKRPLMAEAVATRADVAILTSDNPRFEDPDAIINDALPGLANARQVIVERDRKKATAAGISLLGSDDALLIAGKGHEDYQLIKGVKYHYSDQETARELANCD
ncbi:MAG: UDP-N-acetylmuramoyl-L-alanyl-D-glutamate--2,6-diaminopimelate ligase [Desulfovibrio sp.]|nr:UDP-N-acetylmuramoyl-L-alanyl-D-glutamate--2,6-diaminopimelate ligase [Desulfovibrio sp.]